MFAEWNPCLQSADWANIHERVGGGGGWAAMPAAQSFSRPRSRKKKKCNEKGWITGHIRGPD